MKVSELMNLLSERNPDEELCVLVYGKELFDYDEDDDVELTTDAWKKIVDDFENADFDDVWQSIMHAASEYATDKDAD